MFSCSVYRQSNLVERFINTIKRFRDIATRYDKRPENYLAAVKLIAARIWRQSLCVDPIGRRPIISTDDAPDGFQRQRACLRLHCAGGDGRIERAEILAY